MRINISATILYHPPVKIPSFPVFCVVDSQHWREADAGLSLFQWLSTPVDSPVRYFALCRARSGPGKV